MQSGFTIFLKWEQQLTYFIELLEWEMGIYNITSNDFKPWENVVLSLSQCFVLLSSWNLSMTANESAVTEDGRMVFFSDSF